MYVCVHCVSHLLSICLYLSVHVCYIHVQVHDVLCTCVYCYINFIDLSLYLIHVHVCSSLSLSLSLLF